MNHTGLISTPNTSTARSEGRSGGNGGPAWRRRLYALGLGVLGCAPMSVPTRPPVTDVSATEVDEPHALDGHGAGLFEHISGRPCVIDFWATWCEPCRASIPKVMRLSEAYGQTDLVVAGVHVGPGIEGARAFAEETGIRYPLFVDESFAFSDRMGTRSVPALLVLDRGGRVVARGTELDRELLDRVERLVRGD